MKNFYFIIATSLMMAGPALTRAAVPDEARRAVVEIVCGNRQGSGVVTNGTDGYVLTNAHVAVGTAATPATDPCRVGFVSDGSGSRIVWYGATVVRAVFRESTGLDAAVLRIGDPLHGAGITRPFPFVKTDEFPSVNDPISVYGYSGAEDAFVARDGIITGFQSGYIQTSAQIFPGDSGGAALNAEGHVIGMPTRIVTVTDLSTNVKTVTYELEDIRAVINWLDTFGANEHDTFFTHADFARYHEGASFVTQDSLGCSDVGRTNVSPAVSCLWPNDLRWIFPNAATYLSWFPDFNNVLQLVPSDIGSYRITRNVTFKPGTLVKSATASNVYVVVDAFGLMRWIPSEEKARTLWGPNWAALVHDIPDIFWTDYTVGQALE